MKHIKRLLAGLLIAAMALMVLAACSKEMENPGEVSDYSSEKHFDINDLLQNDGDSEEESGSVESSTGAEPSEGSAVSGDEPFDSVPPEQSGDEAPPKEGNASVPGESQGTQTMSQGGTTGQPSGGTTSQGGTTGQPSGGTTSQGVTSQPSQGTISTPSQGTIGQPSGEITGELVVSDKLYAYNGNNIMLLNVENKTSLHLDVTIKGKYLDKNGNVLKEESQTYRAFPSGWANYYIFHPRMAFASFDYTVEVKEFKATTWIDELYVYNGEPLSTYVTYTYEKNLYWFTSIWAKELMFNTQLTNRHPNASISWQGHILVLDANGEIYATDYDYSDSISETPEKCFAGTAADPIGGYYDGKSRVTLRWKAPTDDLTIPDTVQGKFTVIFAARSIVNDQVATRWQMEGKLNDNTVIEGFTHN